MTDFAADRYAAQAVRSDAAGDAVDAVKFYHLAIRSIAEFVGSRPDFTLHRISIERMNAYGNRINALLGNRPKA